MGIQPFKGKEREALQKQVGVLYRQGLTFRAIGKSLDISHETARQLYLSLTVDNVLDKN